MLHALAVASQLFISTKLRNHKVSALCADAKPFVR